MRPLMEYIRDFGHLTFEEKPFCDMDNIALCEAFYMDIERAAPNHFEDEPMPFDEMARKMFELNGNKNVPMGLILDKSVSEVVMAMGKTKRFAEVKVTACHAVYSVDPPIQFDAGTFILPDGTKVITYRGTDGENKEEVSYIDCTAWGKLGEMISQYAKKGSGVLVSGRLSQRGYEDKNGIKRSRTEIVVEDFNFIGSNGSQRDDGGSSYSASASSAAPSDIPDEIPEGEIRGHRNCRIRRQGIFSGLLRIMGVQRIDLRIFPLAYRILQGYGNVLWRRNGVPDRGGLSCVPAVVISVLSGHVCIGHLKGALDTHLVRARCAVRLAVI